MYDYLIVGSGLFGSVFAHEAKKKGYKCKKGFIKLWDYSYLYVAYR